MNESLILMILGVACVAGSLFLIAKLKKREDRAPTVWQTSETLSTGAAMGTFILLILGGVLFAKGLLA